MTAPADRRVVRPQNKGYDLHPRTRKFVKLRPEKVSRGLALAVAIRASRRLPALPDEALDLLIRSLAAAEHVAEPDIYLASAHGTKHGHRKPMTRRQAEIVQMLADGLTVKEMAEKTGTSVANIHHLIEAAKFSVAARTIHQMIAKAVGADLVEAPPLPAYAPPSRKGKPRSVAPKVSRRRGPLSPRELEVVALAAQGLANPAIGVELGVSEETVKTTMKHASAKLGARGRTQLVAKAMQAGLL